MVSLGVDVTKNNCGRLAALWDDLVSHAIEKQAEATADRVRQNIEGYGLIRSGRMLASVSTARIGRAEWEVVVSAVSDKGFPYPALLNSGGRYIAARPFFTEAVVQAEAETPGAVFGEIRSVLG
jgi:hypothetical protein